MGNAVAHNYATALYELIEKKDLESYSSSLGDFANQLKDNRDFYLFLESYSIAFEDKEKLVSQIVSSYGLAYLREFFLLIIKRHRVNIFIEIYDEFRLLCNEQLGISEGLLLSAAPLSEEEVSSIESSFSRKMGHKVVLKRQVEPNLIGGVKVVLEGRVYDGSIRNKLLQLEKQLMNQGGTRS